MSLKLELLKDALLLMAVDEFLRITEPKKEAATVKKVTGSMMWDCISVAYDQVELKPYSQIEPSAKGFYERMAAHMNKLLQTA